MKKESFGTSRETTATMTLREKIITYDGNPSELAELFTVDEFEEMDYFLYNDSIACKWDYDSCDGFEENNDEETLMDLVSDYIRNWLAWEIASGNINTKKVQILIHYAQALS